MRRRIAVATVLLAGVGVPAPAQVALVPPVRSIFEIKPEFPSFAAPLPAPALVRRSVPAEVKWGMAIGAVVGTTVGAILVSSYPCHAMTMVGGPVSFGR